MVKDIIYVPRVNDAPIPRGLIFVPHKTRFEELDIHDLRQAVLEENPDDIDA